MEEKEFQDLDPAGIPDITCTLEMEIKDFASPHQFVTIKSTKNINNFNIHFHLDPNGFSKSIGWVIAIPSLEVDSRHKIHHKFISWTLSVIDIEGNSRLPRSFQIDCCRRHRDVKYVHFAKYLERSFFLNRADEFLPEGVLTLRCDIFSVTKRKLSLPKFFRFEEQNLLKSFQDFSFSIPQEVFSDVRDKSIRGEFWVYDFTSQNLFLPQFHELRKRISVPPSLPSTGSDSKEDTREFMEHIWIFDTNPDRFLLSLDERHDTVGARLVKASPIIKQCISVPLKERSEKRIRMPETSTRTFKMVLFFLEKGMIPTSSYLDFLHLYKFAHLYEMRDLQRKCANYWVRCSTIESHYKEVREIADVYLDEYLSELLRSNLENFKKQSREPTSNDIIDRLNNDCYI